MALLWGSRAVLAVEGDRAAAGSQSDSAAPAHFFLSYRLRPTSPEPEGADQGDVVH